MPKTLLVVDDSATMRKVFELTLAGEGLTLVTHDGGDGLLARAREAHPAAAVVDVNLGGPNGYDVCRALKADPALKGISVLLVYSEHSPLDEVRAREAGSDGSLIKPFDSQVAIDKIRQVLGGAAAPAASTGTSVMGAPPRGPVPAPSPSVGSPPGPPVRSPTSVGMGSIGAPPVQPPKPAAPFAPAVLSSSPVAPPRPAVEPPDADIVLEMDPEDEAAAASVTTRAPSPPSPPGPPVATAPAPPPTAAPVVAPAPAAAAAVAVSAEIAQRVAGLGLTAAQVDAVAALTREVVERVVWEVVPQLAETLIREEIRRLTAE